jgi:hypothetical protein
MLFGATATRSIGQGMRRADRKSAGPDGTLIPPGRCVSIPATGTAALAVLVGCYHTAPQVLPVVVAAVHTTAGPVSPAGATPGPARSRFGPVVPACHTLNARSRASSCQPTSHSP